MRAQDPFARVMGAKRGASRSPLPSHLLFHSGYAARIILPGERYGTKSATVNTSSEILVEFYDSEKTSSWLHPLCGLPLATLAARELRDALDRGGQKLHDHGEGAAVQILDSDNGYDLYIHSWDDSWTESIPRDDLMSIFNLQQESSS